jgi:hypothetical protein
MTTAIMNLAIQGGGASTPRPAATQQAPNPGGNEDLGTTIREAIRSSVQAQAAASQARAAAAAQRGQATPAPEPTVVIRGSDGAQQTFTVPPFGFRENVIPQQVVDISVAFFLTMAAIIIGLPLARAFARRMDRRGGAAQIPNEIASQLTQLNQAVDAIALEVERISEGQRYTTRLLSEQQGGKLPTGTQR